MTQTFNTLRAANAARQAEWDPSDKITLAYRGNEMGGECGEAQNVIKKLERERLGIPGSRATIDQLAEELADVVICADLIAMGEGIDLDLAIANKFNQTSANVGLETRLALATNMSAIEDADAKWLVRWLGDQKEGGHCGEGNVERRERSIWNDRIERIVAALKSTAVKEGREA